MIFDTDVLIWAARGNEAAARAIDEAADRAASIISFMEMLQGARSKIESLQIRNFVASLRFEILPLSESIGVTAAALVEEHSLAHGIQVADALIAATALEVGAPLCTGNVKHFRALKRISLILFRP